jgi:hypothetical protein
MKLSSIMCASVVMVAGFALSTDGAFAAVKVKSHSNTYNNRDVGCPAGDAADTNNSNSDSRRKLSGATSYGTSASHCSNNGNQGAKGDTSRTSVMPSVGGLRSDGTTGNSPAAPATTTPK